MKKVKPIYSLHVGLPGVTSVRVYYADTGLTVLLFWLAECGEIVTKLPLMNRANN